MAYLDGPCGWDVVCEITSVEITLQSINGKDELGRLDPLFDLRMTDRADIDLEQPQ